MGAARPEGHRAPPEGRGDAAPCQPQRHRRLKRWRITPRRSKKHGINSAKNQPQTNANLYSRLAEAGWRNKTIGPIAMIEVTNEIQRWLERH